MPKFQKVGKGNSFLGAILSFSAFAVIVVAALAMQMGPTNTQNHAATYSNTCTAVYGAACFKYNCPSGYFMVGGSCGAMADPACCTNKLPKATGGNTVVTICNFKGIEYDLLDFSWKTVPNATSYKVYYKFYGQSTYKALPATTDNYFY
jgi:hypothetical protein